MGKSFYQNVNGTLVPISYQPFVSMTQAELDAFVQSGKRHPEGTIVNVIDELPNEEKVDGRNNTTLSLIKSNDIVEANTDGWFYLDNDSYYIPEGFRPKKQVFFNGIYTDASWNQYFCFVQIDTDGKISGSYTSTYGSNSSATIVRNGGHVIFSGSWAIK